MSQLDAFGLYVYGVVLKGLRGAKRMNVQRIPALKGDVDERDAAHDIFTWMHFQMFYTSKTKRYHCLIAH